MNNQPPHDLQLHCLKGLWLVEILCWIAIVAMLAALLTPSVSKALLVSNKSKDLFPSLSGSSVLSLAFQRNRAFTLLEILVVVAIIGVLAALLASRVSQTVESAKRSQCLGNLRQIGNALQAAANDSNGRFPLKASGNNNQVTWDEVLVEGGYLPKTSLACPSDKVVRTFPGEKRSYGYNGYFGDSSAQQANTVEGNILKIKKPLSEIIIVADRGGPFVIGHPNGADMYHNGNCISNHDEEGANYLFADLHVSWMRNSGSYNGDSISQELWRKHWRCDQSEN